MSSTSDAAVRSEIARLKGLINKQAYKPVNSYKGNNTYVNPAIRDTRQSAERNHTPASSTSRPVHSVQGSVPAPQSRKPYAPRPHYTSLPYSKPAHPAKRRLRRPAGRNMVLNNFQKPRRKREVAKVDKQCTFFTRTGVCERGMTCKYQHDPEKTAICPHYLSADCPHMRNSSLCLLSHESSPKRVPLCVHMPNCRLGDACPYPHVNVGNKQYKGVCRDFAVLGFCETGIDCEGQHVRECPDFAETGTCEHKKCKLPHVIRASRHRKVQEQESIAAKMQQEQDNAKIGDDYIPLTFLESEEESEEEDSEELSVESGEDLAADDMEVT